MILAEKQADELLDPFRPLLLGSLRGAHADWSDLLALPGSTKITEGVSTRTRSAFIHDRAVNRLQHGEAGGKFPGFRMTKVRGLWVAIIRDQMVLKIKKLDRGLRSRNIATLQTLMFDDQTPLLGEAPAATNATSGYVADRATGVPVDFVVVCWNGARDTGIFRLTKSAQPKWVQRGRLCPSALVRRPQASGAGARALLSPARPTKHRSLGDERLQPPDVAARAAARGRKQIDVAEAIGVRQPTYSKFENGNLHPSAEQIAGMASALHYPVAFFMQTDRIWGTASPHHRKRKSLSVPQQEQLEAQLNIVRMHVRRLTSSVHIEPFFSIPTLDLDQVGSAAEAARYVRQLWRVPMGPIDNVVRLLEDAGVVIIPQPFPSEKVDAISIWGPGEHPVVFLNSTFPVDRRRRTLAHELGHLVLHASDVTEDPEKEADQFASEFLLPEAEIKHELAGLKLWQLADLKRRWKGAMRSFVYRAQELGQITRDQARYLYMRLNSEFGAKYEPIELPEEQPELMAEIVQQHIGELGYSVEQLAEVAVSEMDDFETLYGPWRRRLHAL